MGPEIGNNFTIQRVHRFAAGFGWRSKSDELRTAGRSGIEEWSGRAGERHCCDPFFCDLRNDTGEDERGRRERRREGGRTRSVDCAAERKT